MSGYVGHVLARHKVVDHHFKGLSKCCWVMRKERTRIIKYALRMWGNFVLKVGRGCGGTLFPREICFQVKSWCGGTLFPHPYKAASTALCTRLCITCGTCTLAPIPAAVGVPPKLSLAA